MNSGTGASYQRIQIDYTYRHRICNGNGVYFARIKNRIIIPGEGYGTREDCIMASYELLTRYPKCQAEIIDLPPASITHVPDTQ